MKLPSEIDDFDPTQMTCGPIVVAPYADLAVFFAEALALWIAARKEDTVTEVMTCCPHDCEAPVCLPMMISETLQMLAGRVLSQTVSPEVEAQYINVVPVLWPQIVAHIRAVMTEPAPGARVN